VRGHLLYQWDFALTLVAALSLSSAAYGAAGDWAAAETDAKECVRRNPGFAKGYHRLANAQKQLGKNDEALATLRAARSSVADADKVPAIKKLMRELNQDASPAAAGGRTVPPAVARELQELQPQFMSIQRELEQVRQGGRT
jgi:tetratricopeptide (TPR) repeat protein